MNVEYMNLSDGTTIVTDENGKINKRDVVSEDTLILENKIEKIQNDEDSIKEDIIKAGKTIKDLKKMLFLILPLVILGSVGLGYGAGFLFIDGAGANLSGIGAIMGLISSGLVSIAVAANSSAQLISEKSNKKNSEIVLEQIQNIKSDLEKQLEISKNDLNKENIKITNEPISLIEKNKTEFSKVDDEIVNKTVVAIKEGKQKKLVFKKRN